jgi:fimbrial chaperone protein
LSLVFSFSALPTLADASFEMLRNDLDFFPSRNQVSRSFQIRSTGDEPVAVQVTATKRIVDINGEESNPEAEDDFIVYPPQMIIPPGKSQTVRIAWVGDEVSSEQLSYRVIVEQLPVNLPVIEQIQDEGVRLNIKALYVYVLAAYVTPNGAAPNLVLESATSQKSQDEKDELVLIFENQGTAYQKLNGLVLNLISNQGQTITLQGEQLKGVIGENILAGNKRRFVLPWPKELPVGPVTATFTTN